jgi:hypothetical protein
LPDSAFLPFAIALAIIWSLRLEETEATEVCCSGATKTCCFLASSMLF